MLTLSTIGFTGTQHRFSPLCTWSITLRHYKAVRQKHPGLCRTTEPDAVPRAAVAATELGNERGCRHRSEPNAVPHRALTPLRAPRGSSPPHSRAAPQLLPCAYTALPPHGSTAQSHRRPKGKFVPLPCGSGAVGKPLSPATPGGPTCVQPLPQARPRPACRHVAPRRHGNGGAIPRGGAGRRTRDRSPSGVVRYTWAAAGKGRLLLCVGSRARLSLCCPWGKQRSRSESRSCSSRPGRGLICTFGRGRAAGSGCAARKARGSAFPPAGPYRRLSFVLSLSTKRWEPKQARGFPQQKGERFRCPAGHCCHPLVGSVPRGAGAMPPRDWSALEGSCGVTWKMKGYKAGVPKHGLLLTWKST